MFIDDPDDKDFSSVRSEVCLLAMTKCQQLLHLRSYGIWQERRPRFYKHFAPTDRISTQHLHCSNVEFNSLPSRFPIVGPDRNQSNSRDRRRT